MIDLNIEELSREFCRLAEIERHELGNFVEVKNGRMINAAHCSCGADFLYNSTLAEHIKEANPDLSDAREVPKVLKKSGKGISFLAYLVDRYTALVDPCKQNKGEFVYWLVDMIIDETGLLLKEAVEFMREVKG